MKIGYLRVSTEEQSIDRQIDALTPICDQLHVERISAVAAKRPVYERVVNLLISGDVFVIWDLDRAFRSAKDALDQLDWLRSRGVEIRIASIDIDTSTPHGMLIYTIISGLAEFERRLLSERTKQGLAAARKRGQQLGRPPSLNKSQVLEAKTRLNSESCSILQLSKQYGVHSSTLSRSLKRLSAHGKAK